MLASILPYRAAAIDLLPLFQRFCIVSQAAPDARLLVFLLLVTAVNMICWLRTHTFFCKAPVSDLPVFWDRYGGKSSGSGGVHSRPGDSEASVHRSMQSFFKSVLDPL